VLFCATAISFYYPVQSFSAIGSLSSMKSGKKTVNNYFIAFTSILAFVLLYSMLDMPMCYLVLMASHFTIQSVIFGLLGASLAWKALKSVKYHCFIAFTSILACILLYSMLNMPMCYFVLMPSHSTIQAGHFELLGASLAWKALKSVKYNCPHCQANWGNGKYIVHYVLRPY
jgi:hypothetical protein